MLGPLYFILFVCSPPCFKNDLSWDPSHSPPQGKGGCDHPNARGLKEISEKKSSAHRYCLFIIEVTFPSKHSFIDLINPQISVEGKGHIIWLYTLPSRSFRLDWRDGVCANTMLPVWMAESGERKPFCRWTNQERLHGRGGWGSRWGFGWGAVSQAQLRSRVVRGGGLHSLKTSCQELLQALYMHPNHWIFARSQWGAIIFLKVWTITTINPY